MTSKEKGTAQPQQAQPQGSFLDLDVIIVLILAVVVDILDVTLAAGVIVSIILGIPFILWMIWKTNKLEDARDQIQKLKRSPQQKAAARKAFTKKALRRGLLYFAGGIIPVVSIFFLWTLAIINTVRGK
jgi:Ca2+/Na+ antiporter